MLPEDIENIIINYKKQIEISKKFKKCIKEINKIKYSCINKNLGININSYSSKRDNIFYSVINTETTDTFIAESNTRLTTIITYNNGKKIIYGNFIK